MVNKLKPVVVGYSGTVLCITGPWHFPLSSWQNKASWAVTVQRRGRGVCGTPTAQGLCSSSWEQKERGSFLPETQGSRWCLGFLLAVEYRSKIQTVLLAASQEERFAKLWRNPKQHTLKKKPQTSNPDAKSNLLVSSFKAIFHFTYHCHQSFA